MTTALLIGVLTLLAAAFSAWFAREIGARRVAETPPDPAPPRPPRRPRLPETLGRPLFGHDHRLLAATPKVDVTIQGVPCRAGCAVTFHRNGRLERATLARPHTVGAEAFDRDTVVSFGEDGMLHGWRVVLPEDREVRVRTADALDCPIRLPAGSTVQFEYGQLRSVELTGPVTVDTFAFPPGTELGFGDSGALSHATLREELDLAGVRWAAHQTLEFEFGHLREGYPAASGVFRGVPYEHGEVLRFRDDGTLARCYLSEDTTISGVPCGQDTRVYLDAEGGLIEGTLATDTVLSGIPVAADSVVVMEAGAPVALTPRDACEVDGVPCAAGQIVELYPGGRLLKAALARPHRIADRDLPVGSIVVLNAEGLPLLLVAPEADGAWTELFDDQGRLLRRLPSSLDSTTRSVHLREPAELDGLVAAAGTTVELFANGRIESLVLSHNQPVGSLIGKRGTRVRFREDGTLAMIVLAADTTIGGVPCRGARTREAVLNDVERTWRETVALHPDGTVAKATLASDATASDDAQTTTHVPLGPCDPIEEEIS